MRPNTMGAFGGNRIPGGAGWPTGGPGLPKTTKTKLNIPFFIPQFCSPNPPSPVDRFVLAKMEAAGVAPAPDADRLIASLGTCKA